MKTQSDRFYKNMFTMASLWNLSIGLTGLIFTEFSIKLFFGDTAYTGDFVAIVCFRIIMIAVFIFGTGYFIVSRDLMLNRGMVLTGLASKIFLFALFIVLYFTARATLIAALALTGDFLWSILFILFLIQTKSRVRAGFITG